jgi:hypothetical protein
MLLNAAHARQEISLRVDANGLVAQNLKVVHTAVYPASQLDVLPDGQHIAIIAVDD